MNSNYCNPIDILAPIKDKHKSLLLEIYKRNRNKFLGYANYQGYTQSSDYRIQKGFGIFCESPEEPFFNVFDNILKTSGINLKYKKIGLQRVLGSSVPHTDPGRSVGLLFLLKGRATTEFYDVDNFIPNKDYSKCKDLRLVETINMEFNRWYLFNHGAIHSVKNIENIERVSFYIQLSEYFTSYQDALVNLNTIIYDR